MSHIRGYITVGMIIGAAVIFSSWIFFDGPCRNSLICYIPGGGITIAAYYVCWFAMFAFAGGEGVVFLKFSSCNRDNKTFLYFLSAHACIYLWYPLFFTTFSQFLSLIVIISGIVLLVLETLKICRHSLLFLVISVVKICILSVFVYINLAFLFVN